MLNETATIANPFTIYTNGKLLCTRLEEKNYAADMQKLFQLVLCCQKRQDKWLWKKRFFLCSRANFVCVFGMQVHAVHNILFLLLHADCISVSFLFPSLRHSSNDKTKPKHFHATLSRSVRRFPKYYIKIACKRNSTQSHSMAHFQSVMHNMVISLYFVLLPLLSSSFLLQLAQHQT